jgi:CpeS-like protein
MTIQEFFTKSAGKWFSQRTSHLLADRESEQQKSELQIELLAADRPEVIALCQQQGIPPTTGLLVTGKGMADWSAPKAVVKNSLAVLVPVPESDRIVCSVDDRELLQGNFILAADQSLTLTLTGADYAIEERQWFASDNLRMRTTVQKGKDGMQRASFCTEIRIGVEAPPAPEE